MVAALYDASLDAFKSHNWSFNIYNYFYYFKNWESPSNLGTVPSYLYQLNWNQYSPGVIYVYDYLNLFGLVYSYDYYGYMNNPEGEELDGGINYEQSARVVTE